MNPFIIAGLLLNSTLMTVNRFFRQLPDWLYLPGLILGIGLIITGAVFSRMA